MSKTFLIGSCEPFSGKSALVLGLARNLIASNHLVRFGKPLATSLELNVSNKGDIKDMIDDDVRFVGETLKLAVENFCESYHLPWVHPELNIISKLEDHYNIQKKIKLNIYY